jgi:5-methylthioadenosine/S-adenosylhomocysteine deaminase
MLLRARWVLPVTSPPIEDGAVVVRGGKVHDVGPWTLIASAHPEERVNDLGMAILLPGLVNAHAHLEITLLRGFLDDLAFVPWLKKLIELKSDALRRDEHVFYALLGAAEMIRAGTTCVADCTDSGAPLDALLVSGLRGVVYQEAFAPAPDQVDASVAAWAEKLDALQAMASDRVAVGLSPHAPYTSCPRMLERAADLALERALPLSIHLAESEAEVAYVTHATGPIADAHRARGLRPEARRRSPVEHAHDVGLLDLSVPVQLVHLARSTPGDLEILGSASSRGRRIGIAACPRSNARLGNGSPDFAGFTRAGVPWGLGTDGAPAVGRCDLFAEMRFAMLSEHACHPERPLGTARAMLERATIDSARALGLDSLVGSLAKGKQADLCAIALDRARLVPDADPYSVVVHLATPDDVVLTMVAGETLWDGRSLATIDEARVIEKCRERAALISASLGGRRVRS